MDDREILSGQPDAQEAVDTAKSAEESAQEAVDTAKSAGNAAEAERTAPAADAAGTGEAAAQAAESDSVPIVFDEDFDANSDEYIEMLEHTTNSIAGNVEEQPRYQRPKLPFKEAVADFFYHHKAKVMVIGVILVMAAIIGYQSIPEKYDYEFMIFAHNYYFDDIGLQNIAANLQQYGEDLDGDGEIKVHVTRYDSFSADYNEYMVSRVYMAEEFRKHHEAYLVLTDKAHYSVLTDEEEGFGDGLFESYKGLDGWIDVSDTELFIGIDGAFDTGEIDKSVGLSLVALNDETAAKKTLVQRHDNAAAMLDRIIADHPELTQKSDGQD